MIDPAVIDPAVIDPESAPRWERPMSRPQVPVRTPLTLLVLVATAALLVEVALTHIAAFTPNDVTLGVVQKIFYFHVGAAFAMLLTLVVGAIFSLADLLAPAERFDAIARASLEVGVLFSALVLTSGPLWARKSWGTYWTWEPRLTLSLLVALLCVAVLALRGMAPDSRTGRRIGAAMAVMAAPAVWLIHVAVKMWGGNHPMVIQGGGIQSPEMRVSFWLSVAGLLAVAAALTALRYRGLRLVQRADALQLALSARDLRRRRARPEGALDA